MKTLMLLFFASFATKDITVTSPAFANNGNIPAKYTCSGKNINPAINLKGIPDGAKTLAIIVDDPDAPNGTVDHWVMWNIAVKDKIEANSAPGTQGKNTHGSNAYMGPCPPSGTHHYHFKVYALDAMLDLAAGADKATLQKAMDGHILAQGELVGLYKK